MIFDLRDETPPTPAERRQGRYTVLICAALTVGLFAVCLGSIAWLRWRSHESAAADRARGESFMAAIVLPEHWKRAPVAFHPAHGFWVSQSWDQEIASDTADLTAVQANLTTALQAAGWKLEEHCLPASPPFTEIICYWLTDGYRLNSHIKLNPALSPLPCPQGQGECVLITLGVEPWVPPRPKG